MPRARGVVPKATNPRFTRGGLPTTWGSCWPSSGVHKSGSAPFLLEDMVGKQLLPEPRFPGNRPLDGLEWSSPKPCGLLGAGAKWTSHLGEGLRVTVFGDGSRDNERGLHDACTCEALLSTQSLARELGGQAAMGQ